LFKDSCLFIRFETLIIDPRLKSPALIMLAESKDVILSMFYPEISSLSTLTIDCLFYGDNVSISFKFPVLSLTLTSITLLSRYSTRFFLRDCYLITGI